VSVNTLLAVTDHAIEEAEALEAEATQDLLDALEKTRRAVLIRSIHASAQSLVTAALRPTKEG